MLKAQKEQQVLELTKDFSEAKAAFFADYKGLTVDKVTDFRKQLRSLNVKVKVVKNNLARIAVKNAGLGDESTKMLDTVAGPTMVAFAYGDAAAVAKVIAKFAGENDVFTIKESLLGNKVMGSTQVEQLSKLPSKKVLLAKMLATMNAPATNFVGVLAAVPRSMVQVLAAIQQKKSAGQ
jgi:large subunit ribosomal protein L10